MAARTLETDHLVIGSGATAMAFVDSLIGETDAEVVMVVRRPTGRRTLERRLPIRPPASANALCVLA